MEHDLPKSINLIREQVDEYHVTTASWDTGLGPSYETGLRHRGGEFTLIQYRDRRYELMHSLIKQLVRLRLKPGDIQEIINQCEDKRN